MVAFECSRDGDYECKTKLIDLFDVANVENKVPDSWINAEGNDVLPEFIEYARPLIQGETPMKKLGGLPDFANLRRIKA